MSKLAILLALIGPRAIRAVSTEARHLYDRDGTRYMRRWNVISEGGRASRVLEKLTGYASIRLHHITREDHDRDLHNHPFSYRTFVLHGFYTEEVKRRQSRVTLRETHEGCTSTLGPLQFHRVTEVGPGGVWTLFCMTRNTGRWGFLKDGRFVPSTTYLKGFPR